MSANLTKNRTMVAAVAMGAGVLAVAGCSSNSSNTPSATPTATATVTVAPTTAAPAPAGGVPAPPPGATVVTAPQPDGAATYSRYKTAQAPAAVVTYYTGALKNSGYTITNAGGGGGGWGQYGGTGAGVTGDMAGSSVEVNAGASKQSSTYFEVCSGPTSAIVDQCQSNNHGGSSQS